MRNTNHIIGCARGASWHKTTKPDAIKIWCSKWGKCAGKVNALTWGDLPLCREGNSNREIGLRWQESAEAIVPLPSQWEGLNVKGSGH